MRTNHTSPDMDKICEAGLHTCAKTILKIFILFQVGITSHNVTTVDLTPPIPDPTGITVMPPDLWSDAPGGRGRLFFVVPYVQNLYALTWKYI